MKTAYIRNSANFDEAFSAARGAGCDQFMFKDKIYHTQTYEEQAKLFPDTIEHIEESPEPEKKEVFSNKLTPAESERLYMLMEECGEVIQACSKVLRHGYDSYHPNNPNVNNRELLTNEVHDLFAVLDMMDHDIKVDGAQILQSVKQKKKYAHHQ